MLIAKLQTDPLGSLHSDHLRRTGRQSEAALLWGLDQRHLAIELPYFDIVTISKSNGPQHGLFIVLGDYHLGRKDVGLVVEKDARYCIVPPPRTRPTRDTDFGKTMLFPLRKPFPDSSWTSRAKSPRP